MAKIFNPISCLVVIMAVLLINGSIAEDVLFSGETLNTNEFRENGPYKFIMQSDCNLVLYADQNRALWSSQTNGKGSACRVTLQKSGNLVIFSGSRIVWASNTARGPNNYILVVQTDGNVVIYGGALWATNTVQ